MQVLLDSIQPSRGSSRSPKLITVFWKKLASLSAVLSDVSEYPWQGASCAFRGPRAHNRTLLVLWEDSNFFRVAKVSHRLMLLLFPASGRLSSETWQALWGENTDPKDQAAVRDLAVGCSGVRRAAAPERRR